MGLRSKAAHFVTDLTTVFLNPIFDEPSPRPTTEEGMRNPEKADKEEDSAAQDGPDTSSISAFLVSLLTSDSGNHSVEGLNEHHFEIGDTTPIPEIKESVGKKSLLTRGRQTIGSAFHEAARISGYRQKSEPKIACSRVDDSKHVAHELRPLKVQDEFNLPHISEPSLLLSENLRAAVYFSLPALAQGRNWVLLYSTWRHGISLSTLYRRSMLCPGYSLLVVGDRKGAVFGGLVEAPLQPTNRRKYQGTSNSFVFTNRSSHPVIFRSTGANRYFTVCSPDFLALGGGGHFALYLDADLLNGSSSASETFANSCLANSEDFEVKEVELWGFVYASQYDEMITLCRTEQPGICRWKPSSQVTSLASPSPGTADSVRHFFKHLGFTDTQLRWLITGYPTILSADVGKTLQPNLDILYSMGFSQPALRKAITANPRLLVLESPSPRLNFWATLLSSIKKKMLISRNRGLKLGILQIAVKEGSLGILESMEWNAETLKVLPNGVMVSSIIRLPIPEMKLFEHRHGGSSLGRRMLESDW